MNPFNPLNPFNPFPLGLRTGSNPQWTHFTHLTHLTHFPWVFMRAWTPHLLNKRRFVEQTLISPILFLLLLCKWWVWAPTLFLVVLSSDSRTFEIRFIFFIVPRVCNPDPSLPVYSNPVLISYLQIFTLNTYIPHLDTLSFSPGFLFCSMFTLSL